MKKIAEDHFVRRHLGPAAHDLKVMLSTIGVGSIDQLIDETIPGAIRLRKLLAAPKGETEAAYHDRLKKIAAKNKPLKSMIGLGYYGCHTPAVIRRCVLENPGWYTPYTPYQAEISQGRLEALFNYQTMVCNLTGMEIANASLLDESTAAAEAMTMLYRLHQRDRKQFAGRVFFVADTCLPQTIEVLRGRAEPLGINLQIGQFRATDWTEEIFGALVQFPDAEGNVCDYRTFIERAHEKGVRVAVAADLMSLVLLRPPGEIGADVVLGSSQRFGIPMGYGGPHAAFFATREAFAREMPGRIIGLSKDRLGKPAYRMALQTREQHIRREKAKSNICTAQALLANIAGFYATYHGPKGLTQIAHRVHRLARQLDRGVRDLGYIQTNPYFFDTLRITGPEALGDFADGLMKAAVKKGMNLRRIDARHVGIALDETTTASEIKALLKLFAALIGAKAPTRLPTVSDASEFHEDLIRTSALLPQAVFQAYHSETGMMRYLRHLEGKDLGLNHAMIPLGSCTMKLNAAAEMEPITWPGFASLHPFAPVEQTRGYQQIFRELEEALAVITGFPAVSLQPNAGAQGEYAGLQVIRAYHHACGNAHRNVVFIPSSAHGTNPASAAMCGMDVVVVECDEYGGVDLGDFHAKLAEYRDRLGAIMITYPSTYGVFEDHIRELCREVHDAGGQVYMDGANMNAQVGLTNPALIGGDVCHLNLHKTFSIPHGGGGPGMGPICAAAHLAPFMPGHPLVQTGGAQAIPAISAAPWGSASILLISHAYICMLGREGLAEATRYAILNANYIKARLEKHFPVSYAGTRGRVAHELIFDLRPLKEKSGIDETDVAKRLMDYGFHAPTVSWPIPGTMMVEPTESEPLEELDRFCDALISIRREIDAVINGTADREDNVLKGAPHTAEEVTSDSWPHAYRRDEAAWPAPTLRGKKFWPAVARIDNPYGDKHLVCSCPPLEAYD